MSTSWFLVSIYLIWIFGVQIDSIEQPIKSNSVGSGNTSHCRASSLYDHLDHCSVVFKHIQHSFLTRRMDVWGNKINIVLIINHSMRFLFLFWVVWGVERTWFAHKSLRAWLLKFVFPRTADDQIPWIKCGFSIQPQLCIQGNDFWFCWTVRKLKFVSYTSNWFGTNLWLPKMHNVPPDVDFESSWSPCKIGVLKQSQSALFGSVSHMAILFVFTCVMNVRDQTAPTLEYQVFQYVPSTKHFRTICKHYLWQFLKQISFLLLSSGGHRCME